MFCSFQIKKRKNTRQNMKRNWAKCSFAGSYDGPLDKNRDMNFGLVPLGGI